MTKNALRNRVNRDIMEERRTLPNIREQLAENILSLTDEQAAYVLRRVKCLLQRESKTKRTASKMPESAKRSQRLLP